MAVGPRIRQDRAERLEDRTDLPVFALVQQKTVPVPPVAVVLDQVQQIARIVVVDVGHRKRALAAVHGHHVVVDGEAAPLCERARASAVGGSETPILVDFWAEWCGPCKMVAPTLAEIADEQRGKLTVAKLNVDDNPDIARRYEVMSIPTLLVFKDGEPAKRIVGAKGKGALLQDLSEFID